MKRPIAAKMENIVPLLKAVRFYTTWEYHGLFLTVITIKLIGLIEIGKGLKLITVGKAFIVEPLTIIGSGLKRFWKWILSD